MCQHKSFWRGNKCNQIFSLAQKVWAITKDFGTCKQLKLIKLLEIWKKKWLKKECTLYKRVMIRSALNFWKWKWKSERTHIFANEWELSEAQKIDERWTRWIGQWIYLYPCPANLFITVHSCPLIIWNSTSIEHLLSCKPCIKELFM